MMSPVEPNARLLDAVRALSLHAALSEADEKTTSHVVDLLLKAQELLTATRTSLPRKHFGAPAEVREGGNRLWVAGEFNPVLPQLELEFHDNTVTSTWTAGPLDEGPPGFLHGGLSAYILDVLSGVLIQSLGIRAVTGTLDLRYLRAVPLHEELHMNARIEHVDRRKHYVRGEIAFGGKTAVVSSGLFIELLSDSHLTASALQR